MEVNQKIEHWLQIISPGQFVPLVSIPGGVHQCSNELIFGDCQLNVLICLGVEILFCQPHVDCMQVFRLFAQTHHKVMRLDVSVQNAHSVHVSKPLKNLVCEHQCCLQRKGEPAKSTKVEQVRSHQVHHDEIFLVKASMATDLGESNFALISTNCYHISLEFVSLEVKANTCFKNQSILIIYRLWFYSVLFFCFNMLSWQNI